MNEGQSWISVPSGGYICPCCWNNEKVKYQEIPESTRTHSKNGETITVHFGPQGDFHCFNCDYEWTAEVMFGDKP